METIERAVWEDMQRGLGGGQIQRHLGLTESEVKLITAVLEADGLIAGRVVCPSCGYRARDEFDDCPRCGVVVRKWRAPRTQRRGLWAMFADGVDKVWDAIDCGGYRLVRRLQGKWKGRA